MTSLFTRDILAGAESFLKAIGGGAVMRTRDECSALATLRANLAGCEAFMRAMGGTGAMDVGKVARLVRRIPKGSICALDSEYTTPSMHCE